MISKATCLILVGISALLSMALANSREIGDSFACSQKGRFYNPSECRLYYECDEDLNLRLGDCVEELRPHSNWVPVYYNRSLENCDYGGCPFDYLTTTTSTTTTTTTTTTTITTTTTTTETPTTTHVPEFSCSSNGYYPDPNSCSIFHVCVINGDSATDYVFNCPASTVYCPQFQVCGWETDCPCNLQSLTN